MYTKISSKLLFPIHEYLKKHSSVSVKRNLDSSQFIPREKLFELQEQKLRLLIEWAYQNSSYYSSIINKEQLQIILDAPLDNLKLLPTLTKTLIREHFKNIIAGDEDNMTLMSTGGSTGQPLRFYLDKERVSHDIAAKWRATNWWGVDIGDPEIVVWGSPIEVQTQGIIKNARDRLFRTKLLSAFDLSRKSLMEYVLTIKSLKPKMIFGYPSAIYEITRFANKIDLDLSSIGVEVVFTTAEVLYEDQRKVISETFNCAVANGYGSREGGFIAHECPKQQMHITSEDIVIEIINDEGSICEFGEQGEIVVTHLHSKSFPFIRYRTGDYGVLQDNLCECGRTSLILSSILGRTTDFIILPDGTRIHALAFIYVIRELSGIHNYKIIQDSINTLCVCIVVNEHANESELTRKISDGFEKIVSGKLSVEVKYFNEIEKDKSGKHRYVVNTIS